METQANNPQQVKTNKVLGIYTIFMVSLSVSYIITTLVNYVN